MMCLDAHIRCSMGIEFKLAASSLRRRLPLSAQLRVSELCEAVASPGHTLGSMMFRLACKAGLPGVERG